MKSFTKYVGVGGSVVYHVLHVSQHGDKLKFLNVIVIMLSVVEVNDIELK